MPSLGRLYDVTVSIFGQEVVFRGCANRGPTFTPLQFFNFAHLVFESIQCLDESPEGLQDKTYEVKILVPATGQTITGTVQAPAMADCNRIFLAKHTSITKCFDRGPVPDNNQAA